MKNYIKLMRLKHYLKNLLIFVPIVFSGEVFKTEKLVNVIFAFISFSLVASVVYIINDIRDKEKDKLHVKKRIRPIACEKISVNKAIVFSMLLFFISLILNIFSTGNIFDISYIFILLYLIINILYSFGLKDIPLLDITILVLGFVIRVLYGACVTNVKISNWLYLTIISLSFYLGLGKRRNEFTKSGSETRKVLQYYNREFLDKNMYMCLSISVVFYALWAVDPLTVIKTNNLMIWTVPIIILLLMKYSMNVESDSFGDPVDVIMDDKVLLSLAFIYGLIVLSFIYVI